MVMFEFSESSYQNMHGCDPRLKQIAFRAIEITPIDFGIPTNGGLRTAIIQKELFDLRRSKCDGYEKLSKHQAQGQSPWAKAIDFFAYVNGMASWDKHYLAVVACAFLQASCELGYIIEWGGLWISFKDYPHMQLSELMDIG
jgi:hypothetical protein